MIFLLLILIPLHAFAYTSDENDSAASEIASTVADVVFDAIGVSDDDDD